MKNPKNPIEESFQQLEIAKKKLGDMKQSMQTNGLLNKESSAKSLLEEIDKELASTSEGLAEDHLEQRYFYTDRGLSMVNKQLEVLYEKLPVDVFLKGMAEFVIECITLNNLNSRLKTENEFLRSKLLESLERRLATYNSKTVGRNKLFASDNQRLSECLMDIENQLGRKLEGTDFPKFTQLLNKRYPEPLIKQSPRLTKEEKMLPPGAQIKIIESKTKSGWSDSRLYKFFQVQTGVKPTRKKTSPLK